MTLFAQSTLGEHRSYPLSPALSVLPGDLLTTDGRHVYLIRAGVVIETREVTGSGVPVGATPVLTAEALSSVIFFRSRPMAVALTLQSVNVIGEVCYMNFSDGSQDEESIAGLEAAKADVQSTAFAKKLLKADYITREPSLENADSCNGTTVSIDAAGETPVILTRNV